VTRPLPAHVVERLGYIRFLHQEGIDQTRRPHPMSSAASLSFHDAAELFYVLTLDHMAVQVNPKTPFEDYWRELSKVVPNLSGCRGMERLTGFGSTSNTMARSRDSAGRGAARSPATWSAATSCR
jgi:hypothetical protein